MQILRFLPLYLVATYSFGASAFAADLTGNWVVAQPLNDGTTRRTYFDLKQDGDRITGGIRTGQFYYHVADSKPVDGGYALSAAMMDGTQERKQQYQVKLTGDELHI